MQKGIYLRVDVPTDAASIAKTTLPQDLQGAFAATSPKLTLQVQDLKPGKRKGAWELLAYIEGEQKATGDFSALARDALNKAINHMHAQKAAVQKAIPTTSKGTQKQIKLPTAKASDIEEVEHEDEDAGLVQLPVRTIPSKAIAAAAKTAGISSKAIQPGGDRPEPPPNTFHGCPAPGKLGDPGLNKRKNRTDKSKKNWEAVTVADIVSLPVPAGIGQKKRAQWSAAAAKQVAQFEGRALQVEGWLVNAKGEGPESCNCHSTQDNDYHLWIVDFAPKDNSDRAKSVVCEVSPRVRAQHTGWSLERVQQLAVNLTKVRISGWLMMDQDHPDQIGKTRGTLWEIHPIIEFEALKGSQWIPLDDA